MEQVPALIMLLWCTQLWFSGPLVGLQSLWLGGQVCCLGEGCRSWDFAGIFLWVCVTFLSAPTSLVALGKQHFLSEDWRLQIHMFSKERARCLPLDAPSFSEITGS